MNCAEHDKKDGVSLAPFEVLRMERALLDSSSVEMRCREVMNHVVVRVAPGDTVRQAARRMLEADVGFLPVCDDSGRVVGVLTDRDLAVRVCAEKGRSCDEPVADVMTREVISCRPGHPLGHAEALMCKGRKSRIVVTDKNGRLVGVISLSDIVQYDKPRRVARTLYDIASRKFGSEHP
jgi:CBS domain-containing protein